MSLTALLQLIVYQFLQYNLKWAVLFNCWDVRTQLLITQLMMDQNIYIHLWNMKRIANESDIERQYLMSQHPKLGVFFDCNCNESEDVLQQLNREKLFKQQFYWFIYDETSDYQKYHKIVFAKFNMAVDADVTYMMLNPQWINTHDNSSFLTYDVYNNGYSLGGKVNITQDQELLCSSEQCQVLQNFSELHEKLKYENRWSLRDITMRVTTVSINMPQNASAAMKLKHLMSRENMHIDGLARYGFQYLLILKDTLECSFFYNFTNFWSKDEVSGGAIGALGIENYVDLASTPILSTKARYVYITPTVNLGKFRQACLFRTPPNSGIQSEVFLRPFSHKVWLCFVMALLLISMALWLTFNIETKQLELYLSAMPSLLTTALIAFGSACCQGTAVIPSSMGGRMSFICLSLLTFIIYNYYTSLVVAILLGSPVKSNIKTIEQLAESKLQMALEPQPYTRTYLNFSTLPGIRALVRNKIQSKRNPDSIWLPLSEGLIKVRDEPGFVYGTESFSAYSLVENWFTAQQICDLNEILLRPEQPLFTHLHRNSSYREMIKIKEIRILETGIIRRLELIWVKSLKCYFSSSFVMQVGLEYTAPLFIMLLGCYVLALMLLVIELQWQKNFKNFQIIKMLNNKRR